VTVDDLINALWCAGAAGSPVAIDGTERDPDEVRGAVRLAVIDEIREAGGLERYEQQVRRRIGRENGGDHG
jgi:hypothetical protein